MEALQLIQPPSVSVALRPSTEDDLPAIITLLGHLGYQWSSSEFRGFFNGLLDDHALTVVLAVLPCNTVVGLMTLRITPVLRLNGNQIVVEELVVHKDYRNRGVGTRLVQFARQFTMKKQAVRLEVLISRTRECFKRRFFEKQGFHMAPNAVYRLHF
jgi:GNAT superfamily N-acetyltransferase